VIKLVGKSDLSNRHWAVICHRIWLDVETLFLDFIFSNIKVPPIICFTASKHKVWIFLLLWRTEVDTCLLSPCPPPLGNAASTCRVLGSKWVWNLVVDAHSFCLQLIVESMLCGDQNSYQVINICTWYIQLMIKQNGNYRLHTCTRIQYTPSKNNAGAPVYVHVYIY